MFYVNTLCASVHFLLVEEIYRITQIFIYQKNSIFVNFFCFAGFLKKKNRNEKKGK